VSCVSHVSLQMLTSMFSFPCAVQLLCSHSLQGGKELVQEPLLCVM
jgi:hypothetical protein